MSEEAPSPRRSRWIEIATALALVLILIAAAAFYPPARGAIDDARRAVTQLFGAGDWTGYYLEFDADLPPGEAPPLLLFADGSFPGRRVRVVDPPVFPGRWSPSGESFAFTSGRRLLIADKRGEVRSLGELLDLTPAGPPVWVSESEIVVTMTRLGTRDRWFVRTDANGRLLDQRSLPSHLTIDSVSADGRLALARSSLGLSVVDLSDGTTSPPPPDLLYLGWAKDGRILMRVIRAGLYQIEARIHGARLGDTLAEFGAPFELSVQGRWIAVIERERSSARVTDAPASVWLVTPGLEPRRVLTGVPGLAEAWPSGDGRHIAFFSFTEGKTRAGEVEVATGRITYACDDGCAALRLR